MALVNADLKRRLATSLARWQGLDGLGPTMIPEEIDRLAGHLAADLREMETTVLTPPIGVECLGWPETHTLAPRWDFVIRSYAAGDFRLETTHQGIQSRDAEVEAIRSLGRQCDVFEVDHGGGLVKWITAVRN